MKKVKLTNYYLWILPLALLVVVGLVWVRPHSTVSAQFDSDEFSGRYVSAETAYDISSVHGESSSDVDAAIVFAATAVIKADGAGNVCGEAASFYGFPGPGSNGGPTLFHGKYAIDSTTGRITINTCNTPADNAGTFCSVKAACDTTGATLYKTQLGYVERTTDVGPTARLVTIERINNSDSSQGGCCATSGFLVHARTWTRQP